MKSNEKTVGGQQNPQAVFCDKVKHRAWPESFLPISYEDMQARGWDEYDFLLITADGYVDHPSFGTAIISRMLASQGYRVAICAQPDFHSPREVASYGRPRLAVLVNGGNMDPMVAAYTVAKAKRSTDFYSPGGRCGMRPDRATVTYVRLAQQAFPECPIAIGGMEASLRRFAHYDYWKDQVLPSILVESGADILMYGMGEATILELAGRLERGEPVSRLHNIRGTCWLSDTMPENTGFEVVPVAPFPKIATDKTEYAKATRLEYRCHDETSQVALAQKHQYQGRDIWLVCNPPRRALTREELDRVYDLPYARAYHPCYELYGGIPAFQEVEFTITHNRGCIGGCAFCSLAFHQGRVISSRSIESCVREAKLLIQSPRFKGYIHDVGGPTANFRYPSCEKQKKAGMCTDRVCLAPQPCPALKADHREYIELLRTLRSLPGVKKVFVRSGIRFDYILADREWGEPFLRELVLHHISGQLKVAPEHVSDHVLAAMNKPPHEVFCRFTEKYASLNRHYDLKQYLVPYLMSSHPGSRLEDAIELALYLKKEGRHPEQVQDFYPTPGTIATAMYFTGIDPRTMKPCYVARTPEEKAMQRALLQWDRPENYALVSKALTQAGREDLIGFGEKCLIPPRAGNNTHSRGNTRANKQGKKYPSHGRK